MARRPPKRTAPPTAATSRRQAKPAPDDPAPSGHELEHQRDLTDRVMEVSPVGIAIIELDGQISFANRRAEEILGLSRSAIVGRRYDAPAWRITDWDGADFPVQALPFARVLAQNAAVAAVQHAIELPDGRRVYLSASASPLRDSTGAITAVVAAFDDVSAAKRDRDLLTAQARVLEAYARGLPLPEALAVLVHELERLVPQTLISVLLLDEDGIHVRHGVAPSLPQEFVRAIDGLPIGPSAGSCGTAMYRREPVIVADIATDPLWKAYRAFALPFGLRSCWSTPIMDDTGAVLGSFAVYGRTPGRPTAEHERVIALATSLAALVLTRARQQSTARENAERLHLTIDATGTGLWDWDLRTNRVRYSREWKRQIGYAEHEIGNDFEEWRRRVHPDELAAAEARVAAFLAAPSGLFESEFRFRHKDGSWRWILARGAVVSDAQGPARMTGIHVDITERRVAEQRVQDNARQLRQILDSMFTFVALLSPEGVVLEVNRAPLEAAGLRREDIVGRPVTESYWWAYAAEPVERLRDAIARAGRGEVVRFDQVVRIGEGRQLTIDVTFAPLRGGAGEIAGIVASASDITEREALQEAHHRSEKRFATVFHKAPFAIVLSDMQGRLVEVNDAFEEMMGYARTEVVGKASSDLAVYPEPADRERMAAEFRERGAVRNMEARRGLGRAR